MAIAMAMTVIITPLFEYFDFKVSFANGLRLWLQLVRDVTVVPSAMGHFRVLHEELRERAQRGDVWVLTRALEEVNSLPLARGRGRRG